MGPQANTPTASPVVRSYRDAWAAQTSVSSSWRVPSCRGCCWWVQVLWIALTSSSSRRMRQIGSRSSSTSMVSPTSRSSRFATTTNVMALSFLLRPPGCRLAAAHLYPAVADPGRQYGLRLASRAAADAAVGEREAGPVQRASHGQVCDWAAAEQATGVAADVVDGVEAAAVAVQHDLTALGLDGGRRIVQQVGLLQRAGPPSRPDGPRHPVDHHTFGEYEMTAEVTGRGRDREAGHAQSACRATVAGHPGTQGGTLQPEGHRVEEAVEEPDATVLIVADGPVAQTGQGGSARREDAGRADHACGAESTPGSRAAVRSVQHH